MLISASSDAFGESCASRAVNGRPCSSWATPSERQPRNWLLISSPVLTHRYTCSEDGTETLSVRARSTGLWDSWSAQRPRGHCCPSADPVLAGAVPIESHCGELIDRTRRPDSELAKGLRNR